MDVFDLAAKISLDRSDYDSGLDSIKSGFSALGGDLASSFQTAFKVASAAVGAASTALVGFGTTAVNTGREFDSAMSQVAATMGVTNEELNNTKVTTENFSGTLREFAQELGNSTAFSATQAAEALNYMALAGYDAETSVNMLPNVLNLAAAGNIDLARASDMVTDAQTALGLSLNETEAMVDQMAQTSSKSNTSVEQLGEAFLTIGPTARSLSGGTAELSTLLGVLADNGTKGSEAGIHLRNIMAALNGLTDEGTMLMEQYTNGLYDSEGQMRPISVVLGELRDSMNGMTQAEQDAVVHGIFNKTDWATAQALISTTDERWNELNATIVDSKGAAEQMAATQLDNLEGDITLFKSALEGTQIAVSDMLTPTLREFVQLGSDGLQGITTALKNGDIEGAFDHIGESLGAFTTKFADLAPEILKAAVSLLEAFVKAIMENLPTITESAVKIVGEIGKGILSTLPQIIQAGLEIVKSLTTALTENIDTIIPAVMEMIGAIAEGIIEYRVMLLEAGLQIIVAIAEYISENLDEMVDTAVGIIEKIANILMENIPLLLDAAVKIISGLAEYISQNLPSIVETVISIIMEIATTLLSHLDVLIEAGLKIIIALGEGLIQAIPTIIERLPEIIGSIVEALVDNAPLLIEGAIRLVVELVKNLPKIILSLIKAIPSIITSILGAFGSLGEGIIGLFSAAWDGITDLFSGAGEWFSETFSGAKEKAGEAWDGIKGYFSDTWEKMKENYSKAGEWFKETFSNAKEKANEAWEGIKGYFSDTWEKVKENYSKAGEWFKETFSDAKEKANEAWDGIKGYFSDTWEKIKGNYSKAGEWFKENFSGAKEKANQAWGGIKNNFSDTWEKIKANYSKAGGWFEETFSKAKGGVEDAWGGIKGFFSDTWDKITGVFSNVWEKFKDIGGNIVDGIKNGIANAWDSFKGWVADKFSGIIDNVKEIFGIASPSKVFRQIGEFCIEGLQDGSEELFSDEGLTAAIRADVETTNATSSDKLDSLLGLLEEYLPGLATKDSFNNVGITVNKREFGRLVSEVG